MIEHRQWIAAFYTARSLAIITRRHTTVHKINGVWVTGYADSQAQTMQTMSNKNSTSKINQMGKAFMA